MPGTDRRARAKPPGVRAGWRGGERLTPPPTFSASVLLPDLVLLSSHSVGTVWAPRPRDTPSLEVSITFPLAKPNPQSPRVFLPAAPRRCLAPQTPVGECGGSCGLKTPSLGGCGADTGCCPHCGSGTGPVCRQTAGFPRDRAPARGDRSGVGLASASGQSTGM